MASITIRNLDDALKAELRLSAARHGHSMDDEVRLILRRALATTPQQGLGSRIRQRFAEEGGVELEVPSRRQRPRAAEFEE